MSAAPLNRWRRTPLGSQRTPAGPQEPKASQGPQEPQGAPGDKGDKGDKGDPGTSNVRAPTCIISMQSRIDLDQHSRCGTARR